MIIIMGTKINLKYTEKEQKNWKKIIFDWSVQ